MRAHGAGSPAGATRVAVAVAVTVAVAACSMGADAGPRIDGTDPERSYREPSTASKDPERRGPAARVAGATPGGIITVYLPGAPGPDTLDPTGGWSSTGNAIQQGLITRSLTQYARGADGHPVLVPDLATDLGRHNDDFTEWTFTIRDDATWEDGSPVTSAEVAFGICRSLDAEAFPAGPGAEYAATYFAGAEAYDGPYTGHDPLCRDYPGISVVGQDVTIKMSRPLPDMDYLGAVMAMGAVPLGEASDPSTYSHHPLSNGPYKVASWEPGTRLVLVRNDAWEAGSDPARHQYVDGFVFEFNQDQAKVDELMLSDSSRSRTAVSTSLGSERYRDADVLLGDRLVQQATQCVTTLTPDYRKITDVRVRKALAYAYPYEDAWLASGEVPGVTRVPAGSLMPPGLLGRKEFHVDGRQITYDPARARKLLAEAGYGARRPYEVRMVYNELDPLATAAQTQVTTGLEASGFEVDAIPVHTSPYSIWLDPTSTVNRTLNLRGVNWCPLWPTGSAMLPPLLRSGAAFNTAGFDEAAVDDEMDAIASLPVEDQAAAWGDLDEEVMTEHFPVVPTGYVNRLFVFGPEVGNPTGDGSLGTPNYKDLYVVR